MAKVGGDSTTYEVHVSADLGPLKALQEQAKAAGASIMGMAQGAGGSMGSMASGALAVGSAMLSIGKAAADAASQIVSLASEGAKLQTMEAAFKGLGSSAEDLKKLRDLTGGLVSDADLMEAFNLAKLFKIPAEEVPKLIKLAQGASAALGTTTAKALSDTFTAASRQSKMIADNMGIVIGDMGKMYDEFAKKRGKSAKDLTDQERMLAFTQKMVAEGGRQMALADIAQGNMAAKAAASYENLTNNLKVSVAEMFGSMGIWDKLGEMMSGFQTALDGSGSSIKGVVGGAFKTLFEIFGRIASALAPAIGIVESLAKVMHILNGALIIVGPAVQGLLYVFQQLSSFLLDVVSVALEGIIRAAAAAASVFDEELARSLRSAADEIAKARTVSLELGSEIEQIGQKAEDATPKVSALAVALGLITAKGGEVSAAVGTLEQKLAIMGATAVSAERVKNLGAEYDKLFAQGLKDSGDSAAAAKFAAEGLAAGYGVGSMGFKKAAELIKDERAKLAAFEAKDALASFVAEKRIMADKINMIGDFHKMEQDSAAFNVDALASLVMDGAEKEKEALDKLEAYYAEHSANAAAVLGADSEAFAEFEASLAGSVNAAAETIEGAFAKKKTEKKPKSGGGQKIDWAKRDYDLLLMLATDHERQRLQIERTGAEAIKNLRKGDADNRVRIQVQMYAELLRLEVDAGKARQDAAFQVQTYLMSEGAADKARRLKEIRDDAEQMRAIVREQGGDTGAIDIRERELVGEEEAKGGPLAMFGQLQQANAEMWGAYRERAAEEQNAAEEEAKKHTENIAKLFQGMGTSIGDTFVAIAAGGADMREQTFKLMGSLFGQLSTAFLAWATAEGSLLLGNPFGAAAAAIALGVVGSAISSFGSRGKGGGATGGTSAMSRQSLERKRDDKDKEPGVVIYNYGFSTPDQIARSVTRGDMRGRDLDGRKRAS